MTKRRSLAEVKASKQPVSQRVRVVLNGALAEQLNDVRAKLTQAQSKVEQLRTRVSASANPSPRTLQDVDEASEVVINLELEESHLSDEVNDASAWFLVSAIAPSAFDEMLTQHAPTKDQKREAIQKTGQVPQWNFDTFPDALIAACTALVVEFDADGAVAEIEKLSMADVKEMRESDDWNAGELVQLFQACQAVNGTVHTVDAVGNA